MKRVTRQEITKFLGDLLEKDKFSGAGKYWAKEVTFDYGTQNPIRVDYMQFEPVNQLAIDGIEKGDFICYEIKSCKEDFKSGHGLNFIAEKNYLVMTVSTYNELKKKGELDKLPHWIGLMVAIPFSRKYRVEEELSHPTEITADIQWCFKTIKSAKKTYRKRSMPEMLFSLLRSRCRDL